MNQKRMEKEAEVAEFRDHFSRAASAVMLDFKGVDVPTITELRVRFRQAGIVYRVVKNSLVHKALENTPYAKISSLDTHLRGQTGIAWAFEDPSIAAKVIKAFRKEGDAQEKIKVKCGLIENQVLEGSRVETDLASMPGKDEIRAQFLAQLLAPAQSLVRQLHAPGQNLTYALNARKDQLS
jgi:large subunit ribosomal protein L10